MNKYAQIYIGNFENIIKNAYTPGSSIIPSNADFAADQPAIGSSIIDTLADGAKAVGRGADAFGKGFSTGIMNLTDRVTGATSATGDYISRFGNSLIGSPMQSDVDALRTNERIRNQEESIDRNQKRLNERKKQNATSIPPSILNTTTSAPSTSTAQNAPVKPSTQIPPTVGATPTIGAPQNSSLNLDSPLPTLPLTPRPNLPLVVPSVVNSAQGSNQSTKLTLNSPAPTLSDNPVSAPAPTIIPQQKAKANHGYSDQDIADFASNTKSNFNPSSALDRKNMELMKQHGAKTTKTMSSRQFRN